MKDKELDFPRELKDFKTKELKHLSSGNVRIVMFNKEEVNIGVYLNKILYKKYKVKKKDLTYEVILYIFSDVEKVYGFGCNTIDDMKIFEMIAESKGIDLQNDLDSYSATNLSGFGDELKRKLNSVSYTHLTLPTILRV